LKAIRDNESILEAALKKDLNKQPMESYMSEIGLILEECRFHLKNLKKWVKTKHVPTPLAQMYAKSYIVPEPYGVTLIMSPWNYPLSLCLIPLIGAISAGNCAVIKPASYAPAASHAIAQIITKTFSPEYIAVVEGGRKENAYLLEQKFDYIFFTGSPSVGKIVMEHAAQHLTPITLELGGKSPVIVDETADIKLSARRIAFGKILNSGQTCVAPDYLFIHEKIKERFINEFENILKEFTPDGDISALPTIINDNHFQRLKGLMLSGFARVGGKIDAERRIIEPTLLTDVSFDSDIMREEIFGPILPLIPYQDIHECINYIRNHDRPLALYLFTKNKALEQLIMNTCSFGGACVNDTVTHVSSSHLGFGGVGSSGMGSYHGKESFNTFTHYRSVLNRPLWSELPIRYHPYSEKKFKILKMLMK
jgi:aldehyde dehydrogenase (NAD+)